MNYTSDNSASLPPQDFSADSGSEFAEPQAKSVKSAAVEKAQNFRAYAGEKATALKGEASVKLKQGAKKAKELHLNAEDYVKENPTKAVLGAVGVGVIIGLILRR